jgi:hypothetical protein
LNIGDYENYISGLYSGTNPQPESASLVHFGQAYPQGGKSSAFEYSIAVSGIHWQDFDESGCSVHGTN